MALCVCEWELGVEQGLMDGMLFLASFSLSPLCCGYQEKEYNLGAICSLVGNLSNRFQGSES